MSHCIATSIVIKDDKIIIKGGDNNVVPRDSYTVEVKRTPEEIRIFVKQDLIGGCIQPQPSANGYFWWYVKSQVNLWCNNHKKDYEDITDKDCDELWQMITELYAERKKQGKAVVKLCSYGEQVYIRKMMRGGCYPTNDPLKAMQMPMYQALYVSSRYRDSKAVAI